MAHFSEQVHITISSFTQNVIYYDLKLSQKMADHHHFSFVWQYTGKAVIKPEDQAKAMRKYIGDEVIFTFKSLTGIRLMSKGLITEISSIDVHGGAAALHITGISHTKVIDGLSKSRTYLERGMDDIVLDLLSEGPTEFYQREAIRSTYMKEFNYMAQYNETNFNFLKRLATRYGQWFYFDGMRMQFGQLKSSKVKLINGASMHSFKIQANMTTHALSLATYDYKNATGIRDISQKTTTGSRDSLATIVGFNQGIVTETELRIGSYTNNAQNKDELQEMITLQTAGSDANSVYYSGISYFPLGIGQTFTIVNGIVEHHLVCIEATHRSEVHGNYACEFKAIPNDVSAPHYTNTAVFVHAETQPAKIKVNNDPEGLGRVKVEFFWGMATKTSQWMRMIQQHGGAGKGSYFIPEIGEEVLVGFEGGNAQCPYVMGTQYNGKESSGYHTPKNDFKVIKTRSGQHLLFEELKNIILSDKKGNNFHIDSIEDTLNITALKTINLNAENINFNASQNITSSAGMNISESAGVDKTTNVGGILSTSVGGNKILNVIGDYYGNVEGDYKAEIKKDHIIASDANIINNSEKSHEIHSQKNIKNNSGENTTQN